ncbi:hypothetical protein HW555_000997 [Spodoptera exigua]|uniref:Uncharacterized protein n=1 Tax=Spodoptera exigua TaxID=7107 RepID=A0A835G7L6_SPOEX|nr:hypothetical protein HW555_011144 [Spodoptera exigua]KAF9423671.1 hypothetical protein HW555_000997 [Spodoptera exigua]
MTQIAEVLSNQKSLEERFTPLEAMFMQKMEAVQAQIQAAGPAKDTIAKVAEEFRTFRELMFSLLGLLRRQITECSRQIDDMETRSRRKALIMQGIPEKEGEDCTGLVLDVINTKLGLNFTTTSIKACHRLGQTSADHHRPLLIRFASVDNKLSVWRAKTKLKGTKIAIREFLTKERQNAFLKARQHFGLRSCWTQDGIIHIKAPDGSRYKVTSTVELNPILTKYPRMQGASSSGAKRSAEETVGNLKSTRR